MREKGFCCVAGRGCKAPAGYRTGDGRIANGSTKVSTKCRECGQFVCPRCSSGTGDNRLCDDCRKAVKPSDPKLSELCTGAEASELAGLTLQALYGRVNRGQLKSYRLGETIAFLRSDVTDIRREKEARA